MDYEYHLFVIKMKDDLEKFIEEKGRGGWLLLNTYPDGTGKLVVSMRRKRYRGGVS